MNVPCPGFDRMSEPSQTTRPRNTVVPTEADWEENLYHVVVPVKKGIAESDDPLTIEALLYRGFVVIDEVDAASAD